MVKWEGILDDASPHAPELIWLSRSTSVALSGMDTGTHHVLTSTTIPSTATAAAAAAEPSSSSSVMGGATKPLIQNNNNNPATWKPLRKCDCRLLNERYIPNSTASVSKTKDHLVYIDGGRKVLNLEQMTISPTYSPRAVVPSSSSSSSSSFSSSSSTSTATTATTGTPISSSTTTTTWEEVCAATWFVRYDYNSSNCKDVIMSTTTAATPSQPNSNNNINNNSGTGNASTTPQSQPLIEFKEDGTTVWSSYLLRPITDPIDVQMIEKFYQEIVCTLPTAAATSSSSSKGTATSTFQMDRSILDREIIIENGTYKVQLQYKNDTLSLRKVPNETGWISNIVQFKPSYTLQRGYSPYNVVGEDIELALGPVRNVVFVIHGIGEALFHRTDIQITGMIQQTNQLRMVLQKKQYMQWKKQCQVVDKKNLRISKNNSSGSTSSNSTSTPALLPTPPPPNRIEFIPIEWYHCLHGSSANNATTTATTTTTSTTSTDDFMRNLQLVTLQTIPALRTIANDVLLDVLLYCTPTFCSIVLQTVTQQIIQYYHTLTQDVFPDFLTKGGQVSMMGHSLGSVILWDLLATAKQQQQQQQQQQLSLNVNKMINDPTTRLTNNDPPSTASYGPSVIEPLTDIIPFVPEYSILLGSPMGMFLSLRNATQLFHPEMVSDTSDGNSTDISSFTLPTNHLYNIFHPSDPVAYRIEPLLLRPASLCTSNMHSSLPEPVYLTVPGEDVRLHVKAMQFTNVVRKSLFSTSSSLSDHGKSRHKNSVGKNTSTTGSTTTNAISSWTSLLESAIANVSSTQPQSNNNKNSTETNPQQATSVSSASTGGEKTNATTSDNTNTIRFPLGGVQNPRIDYCLQPLIVDNEYISAVTAHSSYFTNTDIQDFLIGILH